MPTRPFTDISYAVSGADVKNGTVVTTTTFTGEYSTNNYYVKNKPTINDIDDKYGNRFYNGIFVYATPSGAILGAGS